VVSETKHANQQSDRHTILIVHSLDMRCTNNALKLYDLLSALKEMSSWFVGCLRRTGSVAEAVWRDVSYIRITGLMCSWSASCRVFRRVKFYRLVGGCAPRAGLDFLEMGKSCPCRQSKPGSYPNDNGCIIAKSNWKDVGNLEKYLSIGILAVIRMRS
jgi:hypothetical protein